MARFVVLTPNPALDITYHVGELRAGATLRPSAVFRTAGGKGLNVARVLHTLGCDVTAVHALGGADGRWIAQSLAEAGVPACTYEVSSQTRRTMTLVHPAGDPVVIAEQGAPMSPDAWDHLRSLMLAQLDGADWLVIAGSFPAGTDPTQLSLMIGGAHDKGVKVAVDTSGAPLLVARDAGADLIKANEQEVIDATGSADAEEALARMHRPGAAVLVSRGARGVVLVDPSGIRHAQRSAANIQGNPVGAGDAATAGFLADWASGHSTQAALRRSVACGAAAVRAPVAGVVDPAEVQRLESSLTLIPGEGTPE